MIAVFLSYNLGILRILDILLLEKVQGSNRLLHHPFLEIQGHGRLMILGAENLCNP
jgi:hypothetical protein